MDPTKDILQDKWLEVKDQVLQKWSQLTAEDLAGLSGKAEELASRTTQHHVPWVVHLTLDAVRAESRSEQDEVAEVPHVNREFHQDQQPQYECVRLRPPRWLPS